MALEIERKFLVADPSWRASAGPGEDYVQGYVVSDARCSLRVRIAGERAWLTLKGPTRGAVRDEFEYAIPIADARAVLERLCDAGRIVKTRHRVEHAGRTWEVDVFAGAHAGLVLAELELESEDAGFERPPWLGAEVTHDARYFNGQLARAPGVPDAPR